MKNAAKKLSLFMAVILVLGVLFTGCGASKETAAQEATTQEQSATEAETTPEPTASPEATAAPEATPTPEASAASEASAAPEATDAEAAPAPEEKQIGDITVKANMEPQENYKAINTLDGDLSDESRWSAETDWAHITYDLGAEKKVKSVDIAWAFTAKQLTTFDIAISNDGKEWKKVLMQKTCKAVEGFQNFAFEFVMPARYVRVLGHYNNTDDWAQWISITEVQIKDEAGKKIEVKDVKASSEPQSQYPAKKTIDGNLSDESRWSSEVNWAHITYDLGAEKLVQSVDIAWAMALKQQTTYDIAISKDGKEWTKILMQKTCKPVEGFQNNKFDFAMPARYVRVLGHYNNTDDWAQWISIAEVRINLKK